MRRRWLVRLLVPLSAIALAVGAVGFGRNAEISERAPEPLRPAPARPTAQTAVTEATAFLSTLDLRTLLDAKRRRRAVAAAAAPEARKALLSLYDAEAVRVARSYRRPPRFSRAALAGYRVIASSKRVATVAIWAAVIGGSGDRPPADGWSTTIVSLRWLGERWGVTDVKHEDGPSADWPVSTLAAEGTRFREYRHAP